MWFWVGFGSKSSCKRALRCCSHTALHSTQSQLDTGTSMRSMWALLVELWYLEYWYNVSKAHIHIQSIISQDWKVSVENETQPNVAFGLMMTHHSQYTHISHTNRDLSVLESILGLFIVIYHVFQLFVPHKRYMSFAKKYANEVHAYIYWLIYCLSSKYIWL